LFAAIGYAFGGSGSSFSVPDLRGEFIRSWSNGKAGVDVGRAFGSAQAEQVGSHDHVIYTVTATSGGSATGLLRTSLSSGSAAPIGPPYSVAFTGENRPRNVALLACIRYMATVEGMAGPALDQSRIFSTPADLYYGFKTSANRWVWNDKADGTGVDVATMSEIGAFTTAGQIVTDAAVFASSTAAVVLAPGSSGNVYLRPLGSGSAVNQAYLDNTGGFNITGPGGLGSPYGAGIGDGATGHHQSLNGQPCLIGLSFYGPGQNYGLMTRGINGGSQTHHFIQYYTTSTGSIISNGTNTVYGTTSDGRTKADQRDTGEGEARALIDALKVVVYTPIEPLDAPEGHRAAGDLDTVEGVQPPKDPTFIGIVAQQAYTVYPQAVVPPDTKMEGYNPDAKFGDPDFRPWMIDHSKFVPMLIANLQEANARIDALEARLAALEGAP
jgi:hypothetical protein